MKPAAILALTPQGADLGRRLQTGLKADLWVPRILARRGECAFSSFKAALTEIWKAEAQIVAIAATGIVVRCIAPLLQAKDQDPAVVVLDHQGSYAVSLLSGHLGGANDLARRVAALTGGQAVITTATDCQGLTAIDEVARMKGMAPEPLQAVRRVNMALLTGRKVQVLDPEKRLNWDLECPSGYVLSTDPDPNLPLVQVSWSTEVHPQAWLWLRPKSLVAGMGCNSGTSASEILDLVYSTCTRHHLAPSSLACLVSTSKKAREPGLINAAAELDIDFVCIPHHALQGVSVLTPSDMVHKHMGVPSICEATAIVHSRKGQILVPKTKSINATLAIALQS